jgi:FixJ family two-component response regulator
MGNLSHRASESVYQWGDEGTAGAVRNQHELNVSKPIFVHIIDDDSLVRDSLGDLLRSMDYQVTLHGSVADFLDAELPDAPSCLLLDVRLPRTSGLELQDYLTRKDIHLPIILMTGYGDISMSVKAMKAGAVDFLTKPIRHQDLLDAVATAIRIDHDQRQKAERTAELRKRYELLTPREREVVALVACGLLNKQTAHELSINEGTVKMHRCSAMRKLQLRSAAQLARIAHTLFDDLRDPV